MSGPPAFQPIAFQANAFQAGYQVVAANYSLGALAFGTPSVKLKYILSVSAYSLASPIFSKPTLASGANYHALTVNPYSLGALALARPDLRATQRLTAPSYALGSPAFGVPPSVQNYRLSAHALDLSSLSFGSVDIFRHLEVTAASYSLGPLTLGQPSVIEIHSFLGKVLPYSLGSLKFGFPRLTVARDPAKLVFPLTYHSAVEEASAVLRKLLDHILSSISSRPVSPERNEVRRLVAALRAKIDSAIRGNTLGTQLQEIYNAADAAGAQFAGIERARTYLMSQVASRSVFTQIVFRSALIMTLGLQSKIVTRISFRTQTQVHNTILHMREAFESAKAIGIDEVDVLVYQAITAMGGALINHLSVTELQLPRYVTYTMGISMPSLYVAQRIHINPSRADEIERDNSVVHPAFVPRKFRVLSNAYAYSPLGEPMLPPGRFSGGTGPTTLR